MDEIEPQLGDGGEMDTLADWGSKLAGLAVRMSGIIHILKATAVSKVTGFTFAIQPATARSAIQIARYAIPHARAVFSAMGANDLLDGAEHILRWIRRNSHTSFSKRQLFQLTKNRFKRVEELDGPLALLEEHHYIRKRPQWKEGPGRAPSPRYDVNPEFVSISRR
jgi:hypothetical protein